MSLASILGLGYSGYGILGGVPLLLLPSGTPEDEHLIKSEGAYHPDPASNTGQLPARQRRSLNISFSTNVTPRSYPLLKALTYSWRNLIPAGLGSQIDMVPEVPFSYVVGSQEGYQGLAHVDEVTLSADPESLLTMAVSLTSWQWEELSSPDPLDKMGSPILSHLLTDPLNKPIAGWNSVVRTDVVNLEAIVKSYSLKLTNNWTYQSFLAGFEAPPNPSLISAGNLDVSLEITWSANRQDRPKNSGAFEIDIKAYPGPVLDTIYLDRMVREPRSFQGGGSPNELIQWQMTYYLQGGIPRSN